MKASGSRRRVLLRVAFLSVFLGVAPLVYLFWLGANLEPLSMPLSLKSGEYTSPFFTTNLNDVYQVEIYFLPPGRTPLNLDWKIVDRTGAVIQSGSYRDYETESNDVILGEYRSRRGSRQRIIMRIHQDIQAPDTHPRLHIGLPQRGLDIAEGYLPLALGWVALFGGAGVITLLVLLIWRGVGSRSVP